MSPMLTDFPTDTSSRSLRMEALRLLQLDHALDKAHQTTAQAAVAASDWLIDPTWSPSTEPSAIPGRPDRPVLVRGDQVPTRSPFTPHGRAALIHAIAHIEFNAINLALDAIWRFSEMPPQFYLDWWQVATEEAKHFLLLNEHLTSMGHAYGDFEAHDGLWTMAEKTQHDRLARMALVPRTLEARGLDATPQIQAKLRKAGDLRAVEILDVILSEEVGHVRIGNHWYQYLCEQSQLDPVSHYSHLVQHYEAPQLRPPLNWDARRAAGFTEEEIAWLHQMVQ